MRALLALGIVAVCLAAAGQAEPPIGSRLGERVRNDPIKKEQDSALGAQEMARCLANKQTRTVRQYLTTLDRAENNRLAKLMDGEHECFSMTEGNDLVEGRLVMFPVDIYRGMLSEWMIKNDERTFAALPPLPRQLSYSRPWYALSGRDSSVDEMATCVSESAPAETLALLKTMPYSDDEGAAFGTLGPHLGACLRAGVKVTGNRQSLRAALADAMYQRVANPAPAPSGPTAPPATAAPQAASRDG